MGIPVQHLVETKSEVNLADCVGCGRCITNCPKKALRFSDVRNIFEKIPTPVENDLTADVILRGEEMKTEECVAVKKKYRETSIRESLKNASGNGCLRENQRTSIL